MYDVIVVGARCAGSPLAMLLARQGYRVLLVDRGSFPSDTVRGHFIQPPGVAALRRWGLLEQVVASGCPPIRAMISDLGDFALPIPIKTADGLDGGYAPRRFVLDAILVESAVAAGAELREHFTVRELLWEAGRVVGVRGRAQGGAEVNERARFVVGADGGHSIVAREAQAPVYRPHPVLTFSYWSYFSDVCLTDAELLIRPQSCMFICAPTNARLSAIVLQAPVAGFQEFRTDIERNFFRAIDQVPSLAERVRPEHRQERWLGSAHLPNFFRRPYGPGWALVGDAGYTKDPFTALGISDAFRDAELLANSFDDVFTGVTKDETAFANYERQRNAASTSAYEETIRAASFAPVPPEVFSRRQALREASSTLG